MMGTLATSGGVEITLFAGKSCVVLVGELKHDVYGDDSNVLAQMMVECEGAWISLSATNSVRCRLCKFQSQSRSGSNILYVGRSSRMALLYSRL